MKSALIIFIKNPIEGQVKTRLAASIGDEKALLIYKILLEHTCIITSNIPGNKYVYYSNYIQNNDIWDTSKFKKRIQSGNELGAKMRDAISKTFQDGNNKVLIIGSDCLELTKQIIKTAINKLGEYDVVIGPAKDGGYYLLAMNNLYLNFFENIDWSTNKVFEQTNKICQHLNLMTYHLPILSDIDTIEDLKGLEHLYS